MSDPADLIREADETLAEQASAIDPPGIRKQCPDCGSWGGFHAYVTRSVTGGGKGETAYSGMMSSPCPRQAIEASGESRA